MEKFFTIFPTINKMYRVTPRNLTVLILYGNHLTGVAQTPYLIWKKQVTTNKLYKGGSMHSFHVEAQVAGISPH
jgi:hypothetical protein